MKIINQDIQVKHLGTFQDILLYELQIKINIFYFLAY